MTEVNGYTRVCGLMGHPVEHTLSPVLHNFLSEKLGENIIYVPFHVPEGRVKEAVEGAFALNLLGMNVTVPYKSQVLPYLKEVDELAAQIGAVNTLVRCEGGYKGYNTDMPGLYRAMCRDGVTIAGEEAVLIGAGGAARAVAMLLVQKGAARIWILNRNKERAQSLADSVNAYAQKMRTAGKGMEGGTELARALPLQEYEKLPADKKYLAIQATNVGMFPNVEAAAMTEKAFYEKIHTGYDLIFNPTQTRFMQLVEENGGRAFNGSKMLLYQGVIAYELWTENKIEDSLADAAYERMAAKM